MTDHINFTTLNEGDKTLQCEARIHVIDDVSITIDLMDFANSAAVDQILAYAEETFRAVIENTLEIHPRIRFQLGASVNLEKQNGDKVAFVELGSKPVFLYRHKHHRDLAIRKQILKIRDPQHYKETYGGIEIENDTSGSAYSHVTSVDTIRMTLITPLHYNPRALSTSMRLIANQAFTRHLDFLPFNNDKYCFMHCLYWSLYEVPEVKQFRSLNRNKEYIAGFTEFLKENRLEDFYSKDIFIIDNVPLIEDRLNVSINVYRQIENSVELYYRSSFKHDEIVNILLIPLSSFESTKGLPSATGCEAIRQTAAIDTKDFITKVSTFEYVNTVEAHAAVLNKSYFSTRKGGVICRYCHITKIKKGDNFDQHFANHEQNCRQLHQGIPLRERVRDYKECKNPNKVFDRYHSFYRVPFVTYDWETRTVEEVLDNGRVILKHVPYSYSILYLNVFDPKNSKLHLEVDLDPEALVKRFIGHCKEITRYHHDEMQSIHVAENRPRRTKEINDGGCPWCLEPFDFCAKRPEYNHSHLVGDTLNQAYNIFVCSDCNKKAMVRNKPLKFFAHNGSKYDQNLFLPAFLNDPEIGKHEFLNKSESRFTEVKFGFGGFIDQLGNCKYKLSFNDSMMLLTGALSTHCGAWISQADRGVITDLMKLYYKETPREALAPLVDLSFKKQVFPYSALNKKELLSTTDPIPREYFANTFLMDKSCSEEDYNEYLTAYGTLKSVIGAETTFNGYHNYYLLLDVLLLAVILKNFMNMNHELSGVNPLAFLSTSAYSFNALLKNNKYSQSKIPVIEIPGVEEQKFLKRSIKGGFTMIFNKTNLKGEDDVTFGADFTSLYPTCMSKCKLPYKFSHWLTSPEDKTTEEILNEIRSSSDDFYHFIDCDIAPLAPEFQEKVSLYPMFPETQTISADDYSEDQVFRYCVNNGGTTMEDQKLNTVSFYAKTGYVTSWSYLKQALEVGYKVTKINRVAVFHAGFVLKDYIDQVYKLKEEATARRNEIEGDPAHKEEYDAVCARIIVYKLILNAIYGFCIVNSDSHKQADLLDLASQRELLLRRISSPGFLGMLRVGERVVVNMQKASYTLEYPLMLGSAILWESKLLTARYIFSLHEYLKPKGMSVHPCFYDTDSAYISIKGFRKEYKSIQDFCFRFNSEVYKLFDTTGFPAEMQHPETHNALGFMTLEAGGNEITDFAGVAAKCYSYTYAEKATTKGKGISKALQRQHLSFPLYKSVIDGSIFRDFSRERYSCNFREFKTTGFTLNTRDSSKCFVTLVDLKSYYGENSSEYAIFGSEKHKLLLTQENR